jgi:tetratricopeptide (TPR) repeat protein
MLLQTLKSLFTRKAEQARPLPEQVLTLIQDKHIVEAKALLLEASRVSEPDPLKLALLGEVEFHLNNPVEAEALFYRALKMRPGLAEGHYGLSLLQYETQNFEEALSQAQYAHHQSPRQPRILAQLGLCHIAVKEFGAARDVLRQAVLLSPENVPALNNFAIALYAMGDTEDAWNYLHRALTLKPEYAPAQENLSKLFGAGACNSKFDPEAASLESQLPGKWGSPEGEDSDLAGRLTEWEDKFALAPQDPGMALQLVRHYLKNLQLDDAADVLNIALAHHPESSDLLLMSAEVAGQLGQPKRAKSLYQQILSREPDNVDALLGLGHILRALGQVEDALEPIEHAVVLRETPQTMLQLVFAQSTACHYEACLATCDRVESIAPELTPHLNTSRAVSHAYLGHFDQAMAYVAQAQHLETSNLGFQVFKGMLHLMHENYRDGWQGYQYRFFLNTTMKRLLPYPVWQGEDLGGKTILVLAEQGLGDQVMFASCLQDLLARGPAQVVLEANERVYKTLARSFPQVRVIPSLQQSSYEWLDDELKPDYYIPLADLPRQFRNELRDFPEHKGYLVPDPERVRYWREQLSLAGPKRKVGFTWRGGTQVTRQAVRTLSLEQIEPILNSPGYQFVCLQYGEVVDELRGFAESHGQSILHYPEAISDLDEFAALISALDLVITVCNTTVHYTGGLGKPCWVMTPYVPEWRYGLKSPGMRWYPSVRMFRQTVPYDWTGVLEQVGAALRERLA